ncbi:hypothetical protein GpartN1_g4550.t1 [Galdieria partita]|uniref:Methyltransferase type 12 domain-containing protein n=1 Tax=Galdieria partita TaxID=83374 RepID=A0A9C7UR90_9RHOD|nr:hypothetical protein GpartN1_g4550.t1 [Galdieria partita]
MDQIDPEVLPLFGGLSLEQVYEKGREIQQKALEKEFNYRCVEGFYFLRIGLRKNPLFEHIKLQKALQDCCILEVGCAFGIDGRDLVFSQGVKPENYLGIDISSTFIDLGFELFEDKNTMKNCFAVKSVGDEDFSAFVKSKLKRVDIVVATLVLHVIPKECKEFVDQVYQLLEPYQGMFIGETMGIDLPDEEPFYFERHNSPRVCHTSVSLTKLFQSVGFKRVETTFLSRWRRGGEGITATCKEDEEKVKNRARLAFIAFA